MLLSLSLIVGGLAIQLNADSLTLSQTEYFSLRRMIGQEKYAAALDQCLALMDQYAHEEKLYTALVEIGMCANTLQETERVLAQRINDGIGIEECFS